MTPDARDLPGAIGGSAAARSVRRRHETDHLLTSVPGTSRRARRWAPQAGASARLRPRYELSRSGRRRALRVVAGESEAFFESTLAFIDETASTKRGDDRLLARPRATSQGQGQLAAEPGSPPPPRNRRLEGRRRRRPVRRRERPYHLELLRERHGRSDREPARRRSSSTAHAMLPRARTRDVPGAIETASRETIEPLPGTTGSEPKEEEMKIKKLIVAAIAVAALVLQQPGRRCGCPEAPDRAVVVKVENGKLVLVAEVHRRRGVPERPHRAHRRQERRARRPDLQGRRRSVRTNSSSSSSPTCARGSSRTAATRSSSRRGLATRTTRSSGEGPSG